jgi:hypothetical protein
MIPLLFAAALALTPQPSAASEPSIVVKTTPSFALPGAFATPWLQQDANGKLTLCNRSGATKTLGPDGLPLTKLGDLPPAVEEHAIVRMVNGCPVREVVYNGQTYYLDAPLGGLERDLRGSRITNRRY